MSEFIKSEWQSLLIVLVVAIGGALSYVFLPDILFPISRKYAYQVKTEKSEVMEHCICSLYPQIKQSGLDECPICNREPISSHQGET